MEMTYAFKLLLIVHLLQVCVLMIVIGVVAVLYFKLRKVCLMIDKLNDLAQKTVQTQACNTVCLTDVHGMIMSMFEDKKPDMYKLFQENKCIAMPNKGLDQ